MIETALFVIVTTVTDKFWTSYMWNCRDEHCMKQVWHEFSGGLILQILCENKKQVCARFLKVEEKTPSMLRGKNNFNKF